jgi:Skp family chaperone for outer membrane proteins
MASLFTTPRFLAVALVALSVAVSAAQAAGAAKSEGRKAAAASAAAAAREKAKGGMSAADIRKLYQEVRKQRDVMIADFDALAKQMKDATEDQKTQIREKMEAQKKAFEEVTSALHKQIRDEQRKQRQNAGTGKR